MSLHTLARAAYGRPEGATRSPRSIEYDLFARATQRLSCAWSQRAEDYPAFVRALHDNTRLWRTLAVDVSDRENALPGELRARLFYLYEFTAEHSRRLLKGEGSAEVLVDINKAVMRGLRGDTGPDTRGGPDAGARG